MRNEDGNRVSTGSGSTIEAANISSKVSAATSALALFVAREVSKSGCSTIHVFGNEGIIFFRWSRKRLGKSQKRVQPVISRNSFTILKKNNPTATPRE